MGNKFWCYLFAAVLVFLCLGIFLIAPLVGWWLPPNYSSFGGEIDGLFYVILGVTAVFFILTEAILIYNMYLATTRPGEKSEYVHGNHRLELIWTFVPAVLLILLAVVQISAWERIKYQSRMPKPDGKTQQLVLVARQWEWRVRYPTAEQIRAWESDPKEAERYSRLASYPYDDKVEFDAVHGVNEIHVWKGNKVLIHLKTRDVLHSFFVPVLRLKQDAVPGKSIQVWFEATEGNTVYLPGEDKEGNIKYPSSWKDGYDPAKKAPDKGRIWDIACAEYCGTRHSMMKGRLFVHETKNDFLDWLERMEAVQKQRKAKLEK